MAGKREENNQTHESYIKSNSPLESLSHSLHLTEIRVLVLFPMYSTNGERALLGVEGNTGPE